MNLLFFTASIGFRMLILQKFVKVRINNKESGKSLFSSIDVGNFKYYHPVIKAVDVYVMTYIGHHQLGLT